MLCAAAGIACPGVPYFSNPGLLLDGVPLGEPVLSDAARVLREMIPRVARYTEAPPPYTRPEAPDLYGTGEEDQTIYIALPPQRPSAGPVRFNTTPPYAQHGWVEYPQQEAVGESQGSLRYHPAPNFFGADSFAYVVSSAGWPQIFRNEGTARVSVQPVPDPPYRTWINFPSPNEVIVVSPDSAAIRVRTTMQDPDTPQAALVATWRLKGWGVSLLEKVVVGATYWLVPMPPLDSLMVAHGVGPGETVEFTHRVDVSDGVFESEGYDRPLRLRRAGTPSIPPPKNPPPEEPGGLPEIPARLELYAVYPNPVRQTLYFDLGAPDAGAATVTVYDALGRAVRTWHVAVSAGSNTVHLDLGTLPGGLYAYRLEIPGGEVVLRGRVVVL